MPKFDESIMDMANNIEDIINQDVTESLNNGNLVVLDESNIDYPYPAPQPCKSSL